MPIDDRERRFIGAARRAVLATIAPSGRPRLVPICFGLSSEEAVLYTAIDEKPKRGGDPRSLGRVRDIVARPRVTVIVDRWDEDWSQLGWVRLDGEARLLEADEPGDEHDRAIALLRAKYPQYARQALDDRPLIRVAVTRVVGWGDLG